MFKVIRVSTVCVLVSLYITSASAQSFSQSDNPVESPPVFRVQELLSEEVIQGPDYYVAGDVPVRDNKYLFTVRTQYGDMHALGRNMLELRLREMHSIEQARLLIQDRQLFNGITQTLKQTPQGAKIILGDPAGALLRAPQGMKRMASNLLDSQNRRAGNEERRRTAVQIGCDPETTNPVLVALLDNIAIRKSFGKTGTNLGLNIALPGLGLLSTTKSFKDDLVKNTPSEINRELEKELLADGVWEPIARQFCRERSFTTLQRMIFMDHYRSLRQIENSQFLAHRATTAYNEAEGLSVIREMKLMRELSKTHGISRIDLQGLPVLMLKDHSVVIINASDYIRDSQELRDAVTSFRRVRPNDPATFLTAGKVSSRAKSLFAANDILVNESSETNIAARPSKDVNRR